MFGAGGGMAHPGQHYDRFIYAAMLSRARIEQAWSGETDTQTEQAPLPKLEEPAAFDPEMLKKLADQAESGEAQPLPPTPSMKGFSPAVIEAALAAKKSLSTPTEHGGLMVDTPAVSSTGAVVPAAFRPKTQSGALGPRPQTESEKKSCVPAAFRRKNQPEVQSTPPGPPPGPPPGAPPGAGGGQEAYDPLSPPAVSSQGQAPGENSSQRADGSDADFKSQFQNQLQQTREMLQSTDPNAPPGPPASGDQPQKSQFEVAGEQSKQDAANQKTEAAAAVKNIVSLRLEQAKKAAESTQAYNVVAPEPKPVDPNKEEKRKRSKWDAEAAKMMGGGAAPLDPADPAYAEKVAQAKAEGKDIAGSYSVPSLRELSALARGDPHSEAPVLGELRAPGNAQGQWTDDKHGKSGAAYARDKEREKKNPQPRDRSRSRSRDRDRRRRRRSPSTSPERASKRLFTDKPSFRLTGSSFSSASTKPAEEKAPASGGQSTQLATLQKDDVPDWMKDMVGPQRQPQPAPELKMGKKYLHMPRLMVEVLTHNGGEALRACIEKSGAQIRVETMIEEPVGIISVNGIVAHGETCIREVLANKGLELPPQDGLVLPYAPAKDVNHADNMQDIQIPSELVRHFVGHRGCNLKAITQRLGHAVSIQILPSILPGGFQRIQITGSSRQEARRLVIQHIDELKKQKLTLWGQGQENSKAQPLPPPPPPAAGGIRI